MYTSMWCDHTSGKCAREEQDSHAIYREKWELVGDLHGAALCRERLELLM